MAQGVITAIKGALQKFVGFGEFIATSEFFSKSAKDVASIGKVDDTFQAFYERYPDQYHAFTQFYIFPHEIAEIKSMLIIRAKKEFTRFPEMNRFYDRREFFYYAIAEGYRSTDVVYSLPDMIDYQEKLMGRAPDIAIKSLGISVDKKNFHKLVSSLLKRTSFIQPVNPENTLKDNLKLVTTINGLPAIYLNYIGYGLGVTKDPFADRYCHAYTTIFAGSEVDISTADVNNSQFIDALLAGAIDYPDSELLAVKTEITKNSLYDLINYHRLHYDIDNLVDNARYNESPETFKISQTYVAAFIGFAEVDRYILKRIMMIYAYWTTRGLMTLELFTKFWKDIANTKTSRKIIFEYPFVKESVKEFLVDQKRHISSFREIDNLNSIWNDMPGLDNPNVSVKDELRISLLKQGPKLSADELTTANAFQQRMLSEKNIDVSKEFMSKFDLKNIPEKDWIKVFRENWRLLPDTTFRELIDKIGAEKLYIALVEEPIRELYYDQRKNHLLGEFLADCSPVELLKWANLYEKEHLTLDLSMANYTQKQAKYINGYGEFDKFCALCDLLPSNAVSVDLSTAQSFLNTIFFNPNCQRLRFYERAIALCELFKSKIHVRPNKKDLSDAVDTYVLVVSNEIYIAEAAQTLSLLKAELEATIPDIDRPVSYILKIQNRLSNKLSSQIEFIENLLTGVFRLENRSQLPAFLELLENIAASGKNYYIRRDSELYKLLAVTPLSNDDQTLARIKQFEQRLRQSQSANVDVVLELIGLIKKSVKEAHTDQTVSDDEHRQGRIRKWLTRNKAKVVRSSLIVLALTASAGCVYFYSTRNSQVEALKDQADQIRSLKSSDSLKYREITKLEDSIYILNHPVTPLLPKTDMELPEKDLTRFDHNFTNLPVATIIDTIYKRNPKNIGNHYQQQKKQYGELLIKLNPGCFNANKICTCDALPHIPGRSANTN